MPDLDADTAAILSALPDPTDYTCPFSDHIFAAKAGVELRLRLWPAPVSTPSPWVLWSHGGGFLFGIHEGALVLVELPLSRSVAGSLATASTSVTRSSRGSASEPFPFQL